MEGTELLGSDATDLQFAKHVEAMDGFAGVFPEHKHRIVEAVQKSGRLVGMTGGVPSSCPEVCCGMLEGMHFCWHLACCCCH